MTSTCSLSPCERACLAALVAAAVGCSEEAPAPCPLEAAKPGVPAQIVADDELFLVRFTDGRVACFGVDTSGACALGGGGIIAAPLFSEALTCMDQIDANQISAGRRATGEVLLWGYEAEDLARLNDVDVGRLWPPLPVKSAHGGVRSVVYVLPSGEAAWHGTHTVLVGEDWWDDTDVEARVPTEIPLPSAVVDVMNSYKLMCFVLESGELYCWGATWYGIEPWPRFRFEFPEVTRVAVPEPVIAVEGDLNVLCVLGASGKVYCIGHNHQAQFGFVDDPYPCCERYYSEEFVEVVGLPPLDRLWVSGGSACGTSNGELWCWGQKFGKFGVRDGVSMFSAPERIDGIHDPVDFAIGDTASCAILAGGTVLCSYGHNSVGNCLMTVAGWYAIDFDLRCE